jgi:hypothetical protein
MSVAPMRDRPARWRSWELNPVVVKELRQAVRSWTVTGMLLLFLTVLLCTGFAFLLSQTFDTSVDRELGARVFPVFVVILTGASLSFIPLYVGIRLGIEREASNLDLLYITTLTPERIIQGKFICGAYMALLFFSACMPFMVFTNFLRGVDLPTIFFILICLFLAVCAAIQAAIFAACLPVSRVFKILLALFGTIGLFFVISPLVLFFLEMMRVGVGSMLMGGRNFWVDFLTSTGVLLAGIAVLHFMSVALISPPSANRALPLRALVTLIWLFGAALCFFWTWKLRDVRPLLPWAVASFVVLVIAMTVVISNNDTLGPRVRRGIPSWPAARALAFLFFNGAAGGLVWIGLLVGVTFAVTSTLLHNAEIWWTGFSVLTPADRQDFDLVAAAFLLYAFDYALTALLIHRRLFPRRPGRLAGVLAVLLPAVWALGPYFVLFFLNQLSLASIERLQPGNLFNTFMVRTEHEQVIHLLTAAGWFALMLTLNAPWFIRQAGAFRPLTPAAPRAVGTGDPPRIAATTS